MNGPAVSSGMGTCGLVGQIGVYTGWLNDIAAGTKAAILPMDWVGLILICFVLPAVLTLLFAFAQAQACADAGLNAAPLPNRQLGQNLATPGWNCHHDNFKDSNPNIEWKATLEQAEKIGMGTRRYTLKKV